MRGRGAYLDVKGQGKTQRGPFNCSNFINRMLELFQLFHNYYVGRGIVFLCDVTVWFYQNFGTGRENRSVAIGGSRILELR